MKNIDAKFKAAKIAYDGGQPSLQACVEVARACLTKLDKEAALRRFGDFRGKPNIEYWVASSNDSISRPYRPDLFVSGLGNFEYLILDLKKEIDSGKLTNETVDLFFYTATTAFCLCYDIWKPKSRKTPGTFFEVLMGSFCRMRYPDYGLGKHVAIKNAATTEDAVIDLDEDDEFEGASGEEVAAALEGNSVSTDLVIHNDETQRGAIIPLKITTRERIVQPFAHQRILDSAYPDRFRSFLACVSEVQRDDSTQTVKQICVPGTVSLFQKHLAKLSGLYYCDIPQRYAKPDMKAVINVKSFSEVFNDIDDWLNG